MKNKELIKNVPSSEKVLEWNAKETTDGSQQKANDALTQAKAYADEHKVEKVDGKGLSTEDFTTAEKEKLATLENYTHPEKHTTTDITTNSDARFVSDAQIANWDKKESVEGAQGKADRALADAKAYTEQEVGTLNSSKLDSVEIQNKELLFKANNIEKFRILLPNGLDKLPIATNSELGAIKVGAGLSITDDGILSTNGSGVADSVNWENIVGKPERFTPMEHIHELATTEKDGFMSRADKVKLNGLLNYTHPETHSASMIVEDATHKFVTEEQIENFNDKYTKFESNNLLKRKFDNVDVSGHSLRFYADSVKKFEIEIPFPKATAETIGGIKIGPGLSIAEDGLLSLKNQDVISQITTQKISEWDSKETVTGSQQKADNALKSAKAYVDSKMLDGKTVGVKMTVNLFQYDESTQFYKATVKHNLNTEHIIFTALNTETKENELLSYKIIDANTIEIATVRQVDSIELFIVGGALAISTSDVLINDASVGADTTWSSQKISDFITEKNTPLSTSIEGHTRDISGLRNDLNSATQKTTQLEGTINTANSEIQTVKGTLQSTTQKVNQFEETINGNNEQITTFSSRLDSSDIKVRQVEQNLNNKVDTDTLSRPRGCSIDGSNITTGTLSVDQLKSNNENPIIRLFDNCAIDATQSMNQGKGDALRLKWDDQNYLKISADESSFYNRGQKTISIGTRENPVITFFSGPSIDATGDAIRFRADNNNYLSVMSRDQQARFYINGRSVVRIGSNGIEQGIPATANELPVALSTEESTKFCDFVENDFNNAVVLDENNQLTIDSSRIQNSDISNLFLDEESSYSYIGCIAILASALKEEIKARKALEQKLNSLLPQQ